MLDALAERHVTLPERLRAAGYRTAAQVTLNVPWRKSSIEMTGLVPTSWAWNTYTQFGWLSDAASRPSFSKRWRALSDGSTRARIFSATRNA